MARVGFVRQSYEVTGFPEDPIRDIARSARTCYASEDRSSEDADERLVRNLVKNDHGAMLEFASGISVRIVTDRAIANELVRHRHFSFAQESTRYVNSTKEGFAFILPKGIEGYEDVQMRIACRKAAEAYESMVRKGTKPEIARSVLPLCTATVINVSGNAREWRHAIRLRTSDRAHPMMRSLMGTIRDDFAQRCPALFGDLV